MNTQIKDLDAKLIEWHGHVGFFNMRKHNIRGRDIASELQLHNHEAKTQVTVGWRDPSDGQMDRSEREYRSRDGRIILHLINYEV